jgi:hypothetical protein
MDSYTYIMRNGSVFWAEGSDRSFSANRRFGHDDNACKKPTVGRVYNRNLTGRIAKRPSVRPAPDVGN